MKCKICNIGFKKNSNCQIYCSKGCYKKSRVKSSKRFHLKRPEQNKARAYAYHKQKDIKCSICGTNEELQFHHTNYKENKGFTVCKTCHKELHTNRG